ncbi:sugar phosphate isomerase/epimerase family protein [Tengunoibacter tsumagoiensis]|uniref:Xylose isomerase-like TIM barrel domain-containing protein n=1 Tax=Tengunoibacter tsumagoiensis TaxID=2014871 RepID=A0A402AAV0_9CHLR|nr:sugar phosphate isomerase/epimerase [Tengunoibacter tsumagoiensis]GCE16075.1 hypothetical protein KTT_59340 [Tengunoibacter tsumagoiensis]
MELLLVRHLWGVEGEWAELFPRFKARGYQAIEVGIPPEEERSSLHTLLTTHELFYIPQIFTSGKNVEEHLHSFQQQVAVAKDFAPLKINCHSGSDTWSFEESKEFYAQALAIEKEAGIPIAHETHRGRIFFYPRITRQLVEAFPDLKLCADLSHWVCVCERLLDDQIETLKVCARQTIHLHARVGYEEGPQVPDPRLQAYQQYVEAHERWWEIIWAAQAAQGVEQSTLTPEFGPPPYLHTVPTTQQPVADLEEICDWQAQRQLAHFAHFTQVRSSSNS